MIKARSLKFELDVSFTKALNELDDEWLWPNFKDHRVISQDEVVIRI